MKKLLLALALLSPLGLQALTQADNNLLYAAQMGNVDNLIAALYHGADVNTQDYVTGSSALSYAAQYGYTAIAASLVEYHGADVNSRNRFYRTPLHEAAYYGHTAIVAFLLDHGADVDALDRWNVTPLQLATQGNADIIQLLLNHGAHKYRKNDEGWSANDVFTGEYDRMLKKIWDDTYSASSLNQALVKGIESNNISMVTQALKNGANPNVQDKWGNTPLHIVAGKIVSAGMIVLLVQYGADPNARDRCDDTPLHEAARFKSEVSMALLLQSNADPTIKNRLGITPLQLAVSQGLTASISMLLQYGADPHIQDNTGCTPLHYAAKNGYTQTVSTLLAYGANPYHKNKYGDTPIDYAQQNGHHDFALKIEYQ